MRNIIFIYLIILISCFMILQASFMYAADTSKQITMNFNDVDIRVFIKFISELTGKNFIIDNSVKGKVTVLSPKSISVDEAYKVFESVLEVNGFTTVRSGDVIKVIPSSSAKQRNIPTLQTQILTEDKIVTQIIHLKFASPNDIRNILAPMISGVGLMVVYPPTETIILTEYASNISRLMRIIKKLDRPGIVPDLKLELLHLEYASASKVANYTNQILTSQKKAARRTDTILILPDERLNAIIVIASDKDLQEIKDIVARLDKPTPKGKSKVQVVRLKNADATKLASVLMGLAGVKSKSKNEPIISKNIKVVADKSTNSLVITAEPDEFAVLEPIIARLDSPRKQVFIEAAIVEVSESRIKSLGVNWNLAQERNLFNMDKNTVGFIGSNPGGAPNLFSGDTLAPPGGLSLGLISFPFTFDGKTVYNLASLLNLARTDSNFNVISYPQIMTMENEEAKIVVADNIPFATKIDQSTTDNAIQNIEYKDVGVTLKVTPQINDQGSVRLKIFQEVSRIVNQVVSDESNRIVAIAPTTKRRTAETTVEVKNGETIVIAGLLEKGKEDTTQGVPGLGNIPLLGWLFKSNTKRSNRTNLMIFITPYVINNPNEARKLYLSKAALLDEIRFGPDGKADVIIKPYMWVGF